jgi:hypothetical protein
MRTQSLTTCLADAATDAKPASRAPAFADESGPAVLTEAELVHVAAAGRKPGVSPGDGGPMSRPIGGHWF